MPDVPNIFQTAAGGYNTGMNTIAGSMGPVSAGANTIAGTVQPNALLTTMNQLANPYLNDVVSNAVYRMRERQALDMNDVQAQAVQSKAFGGARQGLVEAELIDRYGQQEDELVSRLLQQGFDTTAGLSLAELGRQASAGSSLVSAGATGAGIGSQLIGGSQTGLGMGTAVNNQQNMMGMQQQALLQQILGTGDYQTNNYINQAKNAFQQAMAGLVGNPLNAATTTTQTTSGGGNVLGQVLGGVLGVLGSGK